MTSPPCCGTVHDHLDKDGRFACETRNPAKRAWLSWTPDQRNLVTTEAHGRIEEFFETMADPQTGIVEIEHHYRFLDADRAITGRSRIRFIGGEHLLRLLAAANLGPVALYGDWDRTPLTPTSPEFIIVAQRTD